MERESLFASDVHAVETALDRIGFMAMTGGTTADNVEAIRVPAYRALRGIVLKHHALVAERDSWRTLAEGWKLTDDVEQHRV